MSWRNQLSSMSLHEIFSKPEITTCEYLEKAGFSKKFQDAFLRPFFAGVFLDPSLETSSRMLEFTYKTFASGRVALPAQGIQAIPNQLAQGLPKKTIEFENPVRKIEDQTLTLASGEVIEGSAVVLATSAAEAYQLLGREGSPEFQSTYCLYFAANEVPQTEHPILMLNGDGAGPINHLVVNSRVSRSYAPDGQNLVSVSVLQRYENQEELEKSVRDQLLEWFGKATENWRLIRCYDLPQALPQQRPPALQFSEKTVKVNDRLFICGDHREHASLQGAMRSGRRAAFALLSDL
jgi:protoporphyrinogen oxidase